MPQNRPLKLGENPTGRGVILCSFALLAMGVVMVHSAVASVSRPGPWYSRVDMRHTIFACAAAVIMLLLWRLDYRVLIRGRRVPLLAVVMLLVALAAAALVYVPGVGHAVGGQRRWIRLGPDRFSLGFQPSELLKVALLVFLAGWLSRRSENVRSFGRTFLPAAAVTGICVLLVVTEDLGTATVLAVSAGACMLLAGVPLTHLATLIPPAAGAFYLLAVRNPSRWARITAMLEPWSHTNPSSYQPRQSLLAIFSGGWTGQGPGNGLLKLGYLPEDSTDFIFAVYCEEWGFIGAALLMGLILIWIWQVRKAATHAGDDFGRLLVGSLGFLVAFQMVLHLAVNLVVAPPTGISLPLVSAGGTSLLITAAVVAMIVSVSSRAGEVEELPTEARRDRSRSKGRS
ncbi:MAG: FtsW/RodA/SpoVE family cell cycle protein [Phycisphaerae bacterium]